MREASGHNTLLTRIIIRFCVALALLGVAVQAFMWIREVGRFFFG